MTQIIYTHPNVSSRLSIKRINGQIVTCNLIDENKTVDIHGNHIYAVVIVSFNNLTKLKS